MGPQLLAAAIALSSLGATHAALAQAGALVETEALPDAGRTFVYRGRAEKHYLRAAVEELGLFGAGLGYYFIEQQQNSIDWALNYDWLSFRQKLTCEACAFDQNFFDTNFVTHPLAGTLYYIAARGNRLSVLESLGYSFTMSTLWEFLGEFRERVSVNDMVVTPLAGLAIGEATTQLGAFFDRSCPTVANQVFGAIFGPSKSIHDAIDDARLARSAACDERGLTTQGGHRFALWAGAAAVWPRGAPGRDELRFGMDMAVTHIDQLRRPGRGWVAFSDGNIASIDARIALDTEFVSDLRIGAHVVPAGVHYRAVRGTGGFGVHGHETTLGLLVGTEYSFRRQVRPAGPEDRIFLLDSPAARLSHVFRHRLFTLEASLDGGATFAGVTALALSAYRQSNASTDLATVTAHQGYSHVLGLALAPRVRLRVNGAELGVEGRGDRFFALRVLDPMRSAHGTVPIYESRRRGELWLSVGPPDGIARATLFLDSYYRSGTVGDVKAEQREVSCGGRLEAVF